VAYKLRATAVRPGFAHNLQALTPVTVLRGFGPEALEYQQTLEIENTWPEKLMYSIMIPHKAWAIRDRVTAVMKFEPIAKGARVISVATSVHESVRIHGRAGAGHESSRPVISMRHEFQNGRAICVEEPYTGRLRPANIKSGPVTPAPSTPPLGTPGIAMTQGSQGYFPPAPGSITASSSSSTAASSSSAAATRPEPSTIVSGLAGAQDLELPEDLEPSTSEVITTLTIPLFPTLTPSHTLDPIHVTHRVRWSILIGNLDGHTSELRCSLPLHVLDGRLYEDARAATSATRRLLLGPEADEGRLEGEEEDMELPSYHSHVRDRVANMYVPATATVRVNASGLSSGARTPAHGFSGFSSGLASPTGPGLHLPHAPSSDGAANPLEWVNSELMLSLSQAAASRETSAAQPHSQHSPLGSDSASHRTSRRGSRASSPERGSGAHDRTPPTPPLPAPSSHSPPASGADSTFVHSSSASRASHGLFSASMRPFTALGNPFSSRSHSHGNLASHFTPHFSSSHAHMSSGSVGSHHQAHAESRPTPSHRSTASTGSAAEAAARAYTTVPDYESSSRGFLGGVPPLSSMSGLPSYAEAEQLRQASPAMPGTPDSRRSMTEQELAASVSRRDAV
jgi:arrestin-related trafficking adapter 4/5/7